MAKKEEIKLNLPTLDDIFSTQEQRDESKLERVMKIPLTEISDFPSHPFQVRDDNEMVELSESISLNGVLIPVTVRPKEDGSYEMVAGHRRKRASELAGLNSIDCIVRNLNDDQAVVVMVDSNLQREKVLPSEKAHAYKMKLEALNKQGKRSDLTLTPLVSKLRTNEKVGSVNGDSREQVRRYIRLTELILPILTMVDDGKIAFRPAVEISYLPKDLQKDLYEIMELEDCTPSLAQAIKMKKFSQEGRLNIDVVLSILSEEKGNQKDQFKISKERISKYFNPGTPVQKIESTIINALEYYQKYQQRQKDKTER